MGILLGLNMIFYAVGYLLPVPCAVMAWIGWSRVRKAPPAKPWRRVGSLMSLVVLTAAQIPWLYYVIKLHQGANLFETTATNIATGAAALFIIPSALAERKIRLWLILGAVSLFFFFSCSTGEIAI